MYTQRNAPLKNVTAVITLKVALKTQLRYKRATLKQTPNQEAE